jgi:hypothetical protein
MEELLRKRLELIRVPFLDERRFKLRREREAKEKGEENEETEAHEDALDDTVLYLKEASKNADNEQKYMIVMIMEYLRGLKKKQT